MDELTIGGLAKQAGVHVETIRYYQRRGLVGEPARPGGDARRIASGKLALVDARIADLKRVRRSLATLIAECDAGRRRSCPIIDSLSR